ncbi:unnamed protein product [Paramecium octaurelia]|uniref:Uncharacterized protein n=1 Tax=Paramecium octaurelia TaxID=43137 RepID=A0A8S1VZR1_PAROT|nr:unnamed protein product [Paramecium octaurelia]
MTTQIRFKLLFQYIQCINLDYMVQLLLQQDQENALKPYAFSNVLIQQFTFAATHPIDDPLQILYSLEQLKLCTSTVKSFIDQADITRARPEVITFSNNSNLSQKDILKVLHNKCQVCSL